MTRLSDQTLAGFLEEVARATPAPGGGSSAAVACALAAGLVEMAAGIELGRPGASAGGATELPADTPARARALRERALALAQGELDAYAPVLEARRRPADDPDRSARIEAALVEASRSPLEIAEAAAEVAELGSVLAAAAEPSVRGDALAGVVLAEAACAAATTLVEINLTGVPPGDVLARVRAARERAAAARADADAARACPADSHRRESS